jgi:hypothetical protein
LVTINITEITTDDPAEMEMWRNYEEHFKQFMESMIKNSNEVDNSKYVHLNKVLIYTSDSSHSYASDIWRGGVSSIDGFSLGRVVPIGSPSA